MSARGCGTCTVHNHLTTHDSTATTMACCCTCCGREGVNKRSCGSGRHPCGRTDGALCVNDKGTLAAATQAEAMREELVRDFADEIAFPEEGAAPRFELADNLYVTAGEYARAHAADSQVPAFWMKNVKGSSVERIHGTSWKGYIEQHSGRSFPKSCFHQGCERRAEVGGHMWMRGIGNDYVVLVPICSMHNNTHNDTEEFLPSKRTAFGVIHEIPVAFRGQWA